LDTGSMMGDCSVDDETFSNLISNDDPFQIKETKTMTKHDPFAVSMMDDCSIKAASFSNLISNEDAFQKTNEPCKEGDVDPFQTTQETNTITNPDPFIVPSETLSDVDPFSSCDPFNSNDNKDDTFWDPDDNPFKSQQQRVHQSSNPQPPAKQAPKANVHPDTSKVEKTETKTSSDEEVNQTISMDDGLIDSVRRTDPTPVRPSTSDENIEYTRPLKDVSSRDRRPMSPQKNVRTAGSPKKITSRTGSSTKPSLAVPANAILGSMLFRQTLASQFMESSSAKKKQQQQSMKPLMKKSQREKQQQQQEENKEPHSKKNKIHSDDDVSGDDDDHSYRVPRSVDTKDDEQQSIVSSVTEEASSFYDRSYSSGAKWNRQVQTMLNQFGAAGRPTLHQARSPNVKSNENNVLQQQQQQERQEIKASLSRSEEEHVNMFRSD